MFGREYHATPEDFEAPAPTPTAHRRYFWPAVSAVLMVALIASDAVHSDREASLKAKVARLKSVYQEPERPCTKYLVQMDAPNVTHCHWTVWRF